MNVISKFDHWLDTLRAPVWLDFIRLVLGVFLFVKGYTFTSNIESLSNDIASVGWLLFASHAAIYVMMAHMVGGALIALGCYTRTMSLINIPVLIGASVFEYQRFAIASNHISFDMALISLVGLVAIFFYGGGRFSIDELRRRQIAAKGGKEQIF